MHVVQLIVLLAIVLARAGYSASGKVGVAWGGTHRFRAYLLNESGAIRQ